MSFYYRSLPVIAKALTAWVLLLCLAGPAPARAEDESDDLHPFSPFVVAGGLMLLMSWDEQLNRNMQESRTEWQDETSEHLHHFGSPPVYFGISGGLLAIGYVSGNTEWRDAGLRVSATLLATSLVTRGLKYSVGRDRPLANEGAHSYDAFSDNTSFPSGHTSMAFGLATSLSAEIDNTWATVGLYTLAAGTGWSRMNDNRHWISDVAAGALIGYSSGKMVQRYWGRQRTLTVVPAPSGLALCWQGTW